MARSRKPRHDHDRKERARSTLKSTSTSRSFNNTSTQGINFFKSGGTLKADELIEPANLNSRPRNTSISSSEGGGVPLITMEQPVHDEWPTNEWNHPAEDDIRDSGSDSDDELVRDYLENIDAEDSDAFDSLHVSFATTSLDTLQTENVSNRYSKRFKTDDQNHNPQGHMDGASAVAVLDSRSINIQNDFDVTDLERPSLQPRRKKGDLPAFAKVSDEDLQATMLSTWTRDREKKVARKLQRQELRDQGLLLSQQSENDLRARYPTMMKLFEIKAELRDFLDGDAESLIFPPMDPMARKIIHSMAHQLGLKSKSHGNGQNRCPVLTKKLRSMGYDEAVFQRVEKKVRRTMFYRTDISEKTASTSKQGQGYASTRPKAGEAVGWGTEELGASKSTAKAKALMEKMGWKSGEGLGSGVNKGIVEPIQHVVRYSRAGLG